MSSPEQLARCCSRNSSVQILIVGWAKQAIGLGHVTTVFLILDHQDALAHPLAAWASTHTGNMK